LQCKKLIERKWDKQKNRSSKRTKMHRKISNCRGFSKRPEKKFELKRFSNYRSSNGWGGSTVEMNWEGRFIVELQYGKVLVIWRVKFWQVPHLCYIHHTQQDYYFSHSTLHMTKTFPHCNSTMNLPSQFISTVEPPHQFELW